MNFNKIYYFFSIFILVLTTYLGMLFYNNPKILGIISNIKKINIVILLSITIIFFLLKLKKRKISIKDIKLTLLVVFLAIFLRRLYLSFFIIIISRFLKKENRLKYLLFIHSFFYISILILNTFGVFEFNNIRYGIRKFENFEIFRNALGFHHPNVAMFLLIPIFSLLYYLYYPKYKKIVLGIILSIVMTIFKLTFSRTSFLLILLFIILILIKDKYIKKMRFLFLTEGFIIEFFTFYLPFYFTTGGLNKLFSGRIWLFHHYLTNYKISIFGYKNIVEVYEKYPLDNIYLQILFENGILGFVVLSTLIFMTMYILFKNEDYKAIRIFSIILIFGFMEGAALLYYFNIIYFIISDYIFGEEKNE